MDFGTQWQLLIGSMTLLALGTVLWSMIDTHF